MWSKRQNEIVQHALSIIAQKGIQEFTTKNLALAVGITEAGLYRHFASKQEILATIIQMVEDLSLNILKSGENENLSPYENVKLFVISRFLLFASNPDLAYIMFNESIFKNEPELSAKISQMMAKHQKFFIESIKKSQQMGLIRDDISDDCLFTIMIGATRLLIQRWLLSEGAINIVQRGEELWLNMEKLIKK